MSAQFRKKHGLPSSPASHVKLLNGKPQTHSDTPEWAKIGLDEDEDDIVRNATSRSSPQNTQPDGHQLALMTTSRPSIHRSPSTSQFHLPFVEIQFSLPEVYLDDPHSSNSNSRTPGGRRHTAPAEGNSSGSGLLITDPQSPLAITNGSEVGPPGATNPRQKKKLQKMASANVAAVLCELPNKGTPVLDDAIVNK